MYTLSIILRSVLRKQSRDTNRNLTFLSDEGPMLETLDYTIRIGSTPTFLYFDLSDISIQFPYSLVTVIKILWR